MKSSVEKSVVYNSTTYKLLLQRMYADHN